MSRVGIEIQTGAASGRRAAAFGASGGPEGMTSFPFAKADGSPLLIAHRGASSRALENSLAAVALAVSDRADMIECDVRHSADGEPFVIHDDRTGRTARENVRVASCDAGRLGAIRLKNGEPIPRLADLLGLVRGDVPLNLDIKDPGGAAAALRVLAGARYRGPVLLSSGIREECRESLALRPDLPCGLVVRRPSSSDLAFCLRFGLVSIHPDRRLLTVLRIRNVVGAGIPFLPYTVDDEECFFRLVGAGAAGVISNRAAELGAAWRRRPGAERPK